MNGKTYEISPIGYFSCDETYAYDVPRQGVLAGANEGVVHLLPGKGFEQALYRLDSFSHIWLVFLFDKNTTWKPMILPPRHTRRKVGLFASRSPYRPSGIGMSCVRLVSVNGLDIHVQGHDLLDGTPILDIKPYLPYADSFPDASLGWTAEDDSSEKGQFRIRFSEKAESQLSWLESKGVSCLRSFIADRLGTAPLDKRRNRLCNDIDGHHVLAYRTWRVLFDVNEDNVFVCCISSGYSEADLSSPEDKYGDKDLHRLFQESFHRID
ncbi:MAG: tRNA (N6-threonylcarbamoyladenosine(37)-N6)-methyltransferase TrmO [Victivallales bacterium]|nr:tRNA (N6-threonylcarbamoyladenosine(37)-N6)-methyltransferase TrmO [Victivallales bacterium]